MTQRIENLAVSALNPAPYNPRRITKEARKGLKASLDRFGLVQPIVVNIREGRNVVVGGHQRLALIRESDPGASVPCVLVDLDEADEKALNVALNNLELQGRFNVDRLQGLIDTVRATRADLVRELRLDRLMRDESSRARWGKADEDEIPEEAEQVTRRGDLWQLGRHRLAVGDSTHAEVLAQLLAGDPKVNMIWTDPPYGVDYEGSVNKRRRKLIGDKRERQGALEHADQPAEPKTAPKSVEQQAAELKAMFRGFLTNCAPYMAERSAAYVWFAAGGEDFALPVYQAIAESPFTVQTMVIWNKSHFTMSMNQRYRQKHEPCLILRDRTRTGPPGSGNDLLWYGPTNESSVWDIPKPMKTEWHPTQKPVETAERPMRNSTVRGDLVLDCFAGSGTIIIAAERMERIARAVERDPVWADRILKRWEEYTGIAPVLLSRIAPE